MKIYRDQKTGEILIFREKHERTLYKESTFYRRLAEWINKLFHTDIIPKEMWKDGHLVDNGQFYAVDRKRRFGFYQTDWASCCVCRDCFNKNIPVRLEIWVNSLCAELTDLLNKIPVYNGTEITT